MNSKKNQLRILSAAMCLTMLAGTAVSAGIVANAADATTTSLTAETQLGTPIFQVQDSGVTYTGTVENGVTNIIKVETKSSSFTLKNNFSDQARPIQLTKNAITSESCPNLKSLAIPGRYTKVAADAITSKTLQTLIIGNDNKKVRIDTNVLPSLKVVYVNASLIPNFSTCFKVHNASDADTFKVYPTITNSVTISSTSTIIQGAKDPNTFTTIAKRGITAKINTNIAGDKTRNARYIFSYRGINDTSYTVQQGWSTKSQYTFSFSKPGTYMIRMGVKDNMGTIKYQYRTVKVEDQCLTSAKVSVNGVSYNLDTEALNGKIEKAHKMTINIKVRDSSTKYQIKYKKDSSSKWTILKDFDAASKAYNITPQSSVGYTLKVITKTKSGLTATAKTVQFTPAAGKVTTQFIQGQSGITVALLNSKGTVLTKKNIDEKATAVFDNLTFGNYSIKVIKAPTGYTFANTTYPFTVNSKSPEVFINIQGDTDIVPAYSHVTLHAEPKTGVKFVDCDTKEVTEGVTDASGVYNCRLAFNHKYTVSYTDVTSIGGITLTTSGTAMTAYLPEINS